MLPRQGQPLTGLRSTVGRWRKSGRLDWLAQHDPELAVKDVESVKLRRVGQHNGWRIGTCTRQGEALVRSLDHVSVETVPLAATAFWVPSGLSAKNFLSISRNKPSRRSSSVESWSMLSNSQASAFASRRRD